MTTLRSNYTGIRTRCFTFTTMVLLLAAANSCVSVGQTKTSTRSSTVVDLNGNPVKKATARLQPLGKSAISSESGVVDLSLPEIESDPGEIGLRDTLVVSRDGYLTKPVVIYDPSNIPDVVLWDSTFRLADDEIDDWRDIPGYFVSFEKNGLFALINGGADYYIEEGLVDGVFQFLENGDLYSCDVFLYNFGSEANAHKMYEKKIGQFVSPFAIPGFEQPTAMGDGFIGGGIVYAHIGQFNVELNLGGYDDMKRLKDDASLFIRQYADKITAVRRGTE